MMSASEFAKICEDFANTQTFYCKGGYMQPCDTMAQYDALCKQYPYNAQHRNNGNVGKRPTDCVCFIKGILWGARVNPRTFPKYASNGVPDITDKRMGDILTDCVKPSEAKRGMILWKSGHVGVALGDGVWVDSNEATGQNGVKLHYSGITTFTKAGKLPYLDYTEETDEVKDFLNWLYNEYKKGGKV